MVPEEQGRPNECSPIYFPIELQTTTIAGSFKSLFSHLLADNCILKENIDIKQKLPFFLAVKMAKAAIFGLPLLPESK